MWIQTCHKLWFLFWVKKNSINLCYLLVCIEWWHTLYEGFQIAWVDQVSSRLDVWSKWYVLTLAYLCLNIIAKLAGCGLPLHSSHQTELPNHWEWFAGTPTIYVDVQQHCKHPYSKSAIKLLDIHVAIWLQPKVATLMSQLVAQLFIWGWGSVIAGLICQVVDNVPSCICKKFRGQNQPKGGRNHPWCCTSTHFLTIFLSLDSWRV